MMKKNITKFMCLFLFIFLLTGCNGSVTRNIRHAGFNVGGKFICNELYSIMIYHNYHRSKFLRRLDYIRFRLNGQKQKLGIMQIESNKFITDSESILITYKKILKLYEKEKSSRKKNKEEEIIKNYCKGYSDDVIYIFNIIKKF